MIYSKYLHTVHAQAKQCTKLESPRLEISAGHLSLERQLWIYIDPIVEIEVFYVNRKKLLQGGRGSWAPKTPNGWNLSLTFRLHPEK